MFALGLASAAPAAGKSGSSTSTASSGATGAGRIASGASSASAGGGSTSRTGGGMHGVYRPAPELDPKRKISEQDCTRPIVHDAGNLRGKSRQAWFNSVFEAASQAILHAVTPTL